MKVAGVSFNSPNRNVSFNAHACRMPMYKELYNTSIMGVEYNYLSRSRHYECLDDDKFPYNKVVRAFNYSFVDRIPQNLKQPFIDLYERITGFPRLTPINNKIKNEFVRIVQSYNNRIENIVAAGYDPVCPLGLRNELPGGPLDRAFVVIKSPKGIDAKTEAENLVQMKAELWEDTDQRILSYNHKYKFPEVFTENQLYKNLDILDDLTKKSDLNKQIVYYRAKRDYETNPILAGEFNVKLAKFNDESQISKEDAKNFAYFIESVRDGKVVFPFSDYNPGLKAIRERIKASPFAQMSNVTQMTAFSNLYKENLFHFGPRYDSRVDLQSDYCNWDLEEKFDFLKDLMKYVSDEQSSKYQQYFKPDDDRGELYAELNRQLLK